MSDIAFFSDYMKKKREEDDAKVSKECSHVLIFGIYMVHKFRLKSHSYESN